MSVVNVEDKYIDTTDSGLTVTTTPNLTLLNGCAPGSSSVTRNGQSIKANGLDIRLRCRRLTGTQQYLRVMIIVDKQPNGAIFSSADVLTSNDPAGLRNVGYLSRFTILHDEVFSLSSSGQDTYFKSIHIPASFHVRFNTGTAGTIADITDNSVYAMVLSTDATNGPAYTANYRFWFVDN